MAKKDVKKVVLAYSGGLDTSVILKWLQTEYGCEVVTFTADLGQGEELEPARAKARLLGIKPENIFVEDLREEFVRDYVFPMFRANALYEGVYLLGTSIARPLIAKKQIEIAEKLGADAVAHGATGNFPAGQSSSHLPRPIRFRSPRTSAVKHRSLLTPICCIRHQKERFWRTRRSKPIPSSISARFRRRKRPTSRPSSRSASRGAMPPRLTAKHCRRPH